MNDRTMVCRLASIIASIRVYIYIVPGSPSRSSRSSLGVDCPYPLVGVSVFRINSGDEDHVVDGLAWPSSAVSPSENVGNDRNNPQHPSGQAVEECEV